MSTTNSALALIERHRAQLALVPTLTDEPCTLALAARYVRKVEHYATGYMDQALGALGPNGFGPAIDSVVASARFHGFRCVQVAA